MRIIAGYHKGRVLHIPRNLPVRPTTDRAKEALFNICGNLFEFEEKSVLDLFSGTGAISFEFVSRGCEKVWAVDQNRSCTEWIKKAAKQFGMINLSVHQMDSFKFMERSIHSFDVIFADPPYDMKNIEDLPNAVFKNAILKSDGWMIVEHASQIDFSNHPYFFDHRKYGSVNFTFFQRKTDV